MTHRLWTAVLLSCALIGCDSNATDSSKPSLKNNHPLHTKPTANGSLPSSADDAKAVQQEVTRMSDALYGGDIDTLIRFTHPKIVAQLGGEAAAKDLLKKSVKQFQTINMTRESLVFPSKPTFLRGSTNEFVIVPTLTVMAAAGQRIESLNYQFGARKIGESDWGYIEGSRINQGNVRSLFPDFPADYEFPKFHRKKL